MTSTHYVYECYDAGGNALYVGCTGNLGQRITSHAVKGWWPDVARVEVTAYSDRESGATAEAARIAHLQPDHNTVHTIRGADVTRRSLETRRANMEQRHRKGICSFSCHVCAKERAETVA